MRWAFRRMLQQQTLQEQRAGVDGDPTCGKPGDRAIPQQALIQHIQWQLNKVGGKAGQDGIQVGAVID